MSSTDSPDLEKSDPVVKTEILLTVLGQDPNPDELFEQISQMYLVDLISQMDDGDLIGSFKIISSRVLDRDDVHKALLDVGNDGSFFDFYPDEVETFQGRKGISPQSKIDDIRLDQGWDDASMAVLASAFIKESGLDGAFASFLRDQQEIENSQSLEF